jgi:hypothetical protein
MIFLQWLNVLASGAWDNVVFMYDRTLGGHNASILSVLIVLTILATAVHLSSTGG